MKLIKEIECSLELKKYWQSLLGKELLENIIRHPERLEDIRYDEEKIAEQELQEFICFVSDSAKDRKDLRMGKKVFFKPFFQYIVEYVKVRLNLKISDCLDETIKIHMALQITEFIFWQWMRCLIEEMHSLKQEQLLMGRDEVEEYEYFCNKYLRDSLYVEKFLKKYPVLVRLIVLKIDSVTEYIDEVLTHLKNDREDISVQLCNGKKFHYVTDMRLNLSDEHFMGKTVVKIRLNNGCVIYHKPHGLSPAAYYNKLQQWMFEKCGLDSFLYRICDREDYGWEREVSVLSCSGQREVEAYYIRIGIQICLAYILGITDLHFENIIPHGEYPVIVDMEFISDRRLSEAVHPDSVKELLKDTVANTGLLPTSIGDRSGLNVGGLGEVREQTAPYKMPAIINAGTSDMAIAYREPKVHANHSLPTLNGEKIDYRDYISCIMDGFSKAYKVILYDKETFIKKFADGFEEKSRFLIRSTQEYFMYQNTMNFPALMRDGVVGKLMLVHMDKGLHCNELYRKEILNYEMEAVYYHMIPVFYAYGKDLYMGNGSCLSNYFWDDGKTQILGRIEKLSEKDYCLQKKIMELKFLAQWKLCFNNSGKKEFLRQNHISADTWNENDGFTLSELTPEIIGDLLVNDMLACKDEIGWIGIHYSRSGKIYPGFIDLYLYSGLCGIAIFFAALSKQSEDKRYLQIGQQVIEILFRHTDEVCSGIGGVSVDNWGLFTGEASFIYTYLILYKITGKEIFSDYAEKHGNFVLKNIGNITGCDLLSGKAGVIIAIILLYRKTNEDFWLDAAEAIADVLIREGIPAAGGIGWKEHGDIPLAGMAHGNSGIALAFGYLYQYTRKVRYLDIVRAAIRYEDTLYDPGKRNWMDLRNYHGDERDKQDTVAWCHGAAGILSARMSIQRMTGLDMETLFGATLSSDCNENFFSADKTIKNIVEKIRQSKKSDLCLCHGNIGLMIIIHDSLRSMDLTYDDCRDWEQNKLSMEDRNNPGFMTGLSGIGYMLLRKYDKKMPEIFGF